MPLKTISESPIRRAIPYVVAVVIFFAVSALYFAPQYEGKVLSQHDVTMYDGMSRDIKQHRAAFNEDPQWAGAMFSGMPAYQITVFYPAMILRNTAGKVVNWFGQPAASIFFAMLCFWIMLLLIGVNPWIGIIPSLAYGLSTYFFLIVGAGHVTKLLALVYAPLMMGAIFYTFRRNIWIGSALTALFASLEIGAGHPQITYYFLLVIAGYWISELIFAIREKRVPRFAKATAMLLLAGVLAVGSNFTTLWYTAEHTKETTRGGSELAATESINSKGLDLQYATSWSYGPTESLNMFIPNLMGGSSSGGFSADGEVADALSQYGARNMATSLPAYWGDQPITAGPTYLGAVTIFLCILGFFILDGRRKWWIAAVSLLGLFLAWGNHMMWFTELAFRTLPGYNKFRTVSMALIILEWTVPFLAALVLSSLWRGEIANDRLVKGLKWSLGITGGIALLMIILGKGLFNFSSPIDAQLPNDVAAAMQQERASMLFSDSLRSLLFVVLTAGVIWLYAVGKIKKWLFITAGALLLLADMVPVNLRYLPQSAFKEKRETKIVATAADQAIMEDKEPGYRVLNTTVSPFNDATTSYFHRSVGGYHGAKLSRYQDLIDRYLSKMDLRIYNMLNTKYIIVGDPKTGAPTAQLNEEANGPAWFVDKVYLVNGAQEEIDGLDKIDNKREAVVDSRFEECLAGINMEGVDTSATITLTEYRPNYLRYESSSATDEIAVFSEIYFPDGWTAYIDGEESPYFRADYVLRGMVIPAGDHLIEWKFRAPNFERVEATTLSFCIIILMAVAAAIVALIVRHFRKPSNQTTEE